MFYTDNVLDNSDIAQIFISIREISHLLYNKICKNNESTFLT